MIRDLAAMATREYDLVIVGGGVTGACIARDAAMRGLTVALVDKGDFGHATTAASSKLIHGGLRYLQYLQLGIVRESLRERRIWSNIAPHMIDPLTFLIPTRRSQIKKSLVLSAALTAYDMLSYDRNRLDDPEKAIPPHRNLSRDEAIALEPGLESKDLSGAMTFTDYQMHSPERLALECILDADALGADTANYARVVQFCVEEQRVVGVRVEDLLDGDAPHMLRGKLIINASGAWADMLMAEIGNSEHHRRLIRSKGIHLITRSLTHGHAIGVQTKEAHFFILPWRGHSLIGTTDTLFSGDPDGCGVLESDIESFLALVNKGYPSAQLTRADVLHFYAGLRPIVDMEPPGGKSAQSGTAYKASRAAEVHDHEVHDQLRGALTVIGGKWTTSRSLAEKVVDLAATKLARKAPPCRTGQTPTFGGGIGPYHDFEAAAVRRHPAIAPEIVRNLAMNYGSRTDDVLALAQDRPELAERLGPTTPDIGAQVLYAVQREMACTLGDVLFRRTGIGTLGHPGAEAIARVTSIMAKALGWDNAECERQERDALARYATLPERAEARG